MNSIFIIAHAPLAQAMREVALHVFPEAATCITAFDVQCHDSLESTLEQAEKLWQQHVTNCTRTTAAQGVLVLTDMLGATPCNIARQLAEKHAAKLVCGVNVPMLLRVLTYKNESLDQLAARAVAGGTQGVMTVAMTAPQHQTLIRHDQNQHDHQQ